MSFGHELIDGIRSVGSREALVCGDLRLTGEQVLSLVSGGAARLATDGVRPGDTIACLYGRQPESILSRIMAIALGCRFIHVWSDVPSSVAAKAIRALDASILLCEPSRDSDAGALLSAFPALTPYRLGRTGTDLFATPGTLPLSMPAPPIPGDISSVRFSSGTTGDQKAIAYSHQAEEAQFTTAKLIDGPRPWRFLVASHRDVLARTSLWTMAGGGTAILQYDNHPEQVLKTIARERVTHLAGGGPAQLYRLIEHLALTGAAPDSLRRVTYGGAAAVPSRTAKAIETLGPILMQTYGSTEAGYITALQPTDHTRPELSASVGRAAPGVELQVRDQQANELTVGEIGEVWVRSPQLMTGYVGDPQRTADVLRDGWLRTGDLGRLDTEGYLYLMDRVEDRLPAGVYCHPIEHVLTSHPAVVEAAVFALPHAAGPVLAGAVVKRDGHEVNLAALRALVRESLGAHHEPRHLWLVDEIPRTHGGKPDKAALQNLANEPA